MQTIARTQTILFEADTRWVKIPSYEKGAISYRRTVQLASGTFVFRVFISPGRPKISFVWNEVGVVGAEVSHHEDPRQILHQVESLLLDLLYGF